MKLVASTYNSDENSVISKLESNEVHSPVSVSKLPQKIYSIKNDKIDGIITVSQPKKIITNTFASIITGGRSPENDCNSIIDLNTDEVNEPVNSVNIKVETELDTKLFKRKRRIEFNNRHSPVETQKPTISFQPDTNDDSKPLSDELSNDTVNTASQNLYANFQRESINVGVNADDKNAVDDDEDNVIKLQQEVFKLKSIIEAKLKFLCDGRSEVPAVQAIMIQLEVNHYLSTKKIK